MRIPQGSYRIREGSRVRAKELMHSHENPNPHFRENPPCNAALQLARF